MFNIWGNYVSYAAIVLNLWLLWSACAIGDKGFQLLSILNMILLTLGLLLRPSKKKDDE
tara:strand:- start:905 stop:1081 length:177 start_codon:yes stop_codon:yes gene_type:complete